MAPWCTFRPLPSPHRQCMCTCLRWVPFSLGWFLGSLPSQTPQFTLALGETYISSCNLQTCGKLRGLFKYLSHPDVTIFFPGYICGPPFLCCSWKTRHQFFLHLGLPWSCQELFCSFLLLPLTLVGRGDEDTTFSTLPSSTSSFRVYFTPSSAFLKLGTIVFWGQVVLCCRGASCGL